LQKTELFKRSDRRVEQIRDSAYLAHDDALVFTRSIRAGVVDLVFLDPPFNLGKSYGIHGMDDRSTPEAYARYIESVLKECVRIMAPGASLYMYHVPSWGLKFGAFLTHRLVLNHWIAVSMKNGFARGRRLYPAHYSLLYFSKGPAAHFLRPKVRPQRCRHCDGYVKDYGGYRPIIEGNGGVNLSDIWDDLSPVRHSRNKHREANELPTALTDRVVAISGSPGGVLVDPFCGTGTALVSAAARGMIVLGSDASADSVDICRTRLGAVAGFAGSSVAESDGGVHASSSIHHD
jgi:site-specific DNA-methyltransferase (adenine-specific)